MHSAGVELTAREHEAMAWVARGKTNAEIAGRSWLAPSTVRKHLEQIYAKLGGELQNCGCGSLVPRLVDRAE
jgi:DNA-binding CsgD family transcriptional regulator